MTDDGWFDAGAIPKLELMVGSDVVGEILDLFFETTPERIEHVRSGDTQLAAQALHSLKSSAGMVGATGLQELAQDLEQLAWDGKGDALARRLGELDAAVARLEPRLEAERKRIGR